jgi:hypothetical protein
MIAKGIVLKTQLPLLCRCCCCWCYCRLMMQRLRQLPRHSVTSWLMRQILSQQQ